MRFVRAAAASLTASAVVSLAASSAHADDTIRRPGAHADYGVEIEPHLTLGDDSVFAAAGYGVGARFGIPIVRNGFVPSLNNNVAINFGVDLVHYGSCYAGNLGCGANYLLFPVALQWNFFVARQWSVYGEGGLFIYKGFISNDNVCSGNVCIGTPSDVGVLPTFAVGGRYHINDHVALNLRVGYPTVTFGVSFW